MNEQARLLRGRDALARFDKAGREDAGVAVALDERVDGIAVGRDRRSYQPAVLIFEGRRRLQDASAAAHGHLEGGVGILDENRDVLDAVAVQGDVARDLVVGNQTCGKHEAQLILRQEIADAIAHARFGAGVGDLIESEGGHVIVGRLLGVADVKLDVVPVDLRERIAARLGRCAHVERTWRSLAGCPVESGRHGDVGRAAPFGAKRFLRD